MAEELINYIRENLAKGVPKDQIRQSLLTSGWKQADIDAAFLQLEAPPSSLPPFPIKPPSAQNPPLKIKEQKSWLNPKILIGVIVLTLLITAGSSSYFLFIKEKPAVEENKQIPTSDSQKQTDSSQDQPSSPQAQQTQSQTSLPATWSECKVLPNESDYVPERIFIPGIVNEYFVADSRSDYQPQGFLGKYGRNATQENLKVLKPEDFGNQFTITVKKRSEGEDGNIDNIWQVYNQEYAPLGPKLIKKTYYGHEASVISGDSGEGLQSLIYSLISSHDIFIQINARGDETKAETYYQEWLRTICQKN